LRQTTRLGLFAAVILLDPLRAKRRERAFARASVRRALNGARRTDITPVTILMVYRKRNARFVQLFLDEVGAGADVRLWALDETDPALEMHTAGSGPGTRFTHFNHLYQSRPSRDDSWVVLADDDFLFVRGGLLRTINLMKRAGFALAQPGQSAMGWWTSTFNIARPFLVARDTNYVEQGPLVIVSPDFAKHILPLPESDDMGWGIEAVWFRKKEHGTRFGIIDDCRIVHWKRNATDYASAPEMERMYERLASADVKSIWQLQSVNSRWSRWQQSPSWK